MTKGELLLQVEANGDIWLSRIEKLKRVYLEVDKPEDQRRRAFRLAFTLNQRVLNLMKFSRRVQSSGVKHYAWVTGLFVILLFTRCSKDRTCQCTNTITTTQTTMQASGTPTTTSSSYTTSTKETFESTNKNAVAQCVPRSSTTTSKDHTTTTKSSCASID